MSEYAVIGDWGTSNLRLFRVEAGRIVARRDGPGIGVVGREAEAAFAETIAPWLEDGLPTSIRLTCPRHSFLNSYLSEYIRRSSASTCHSPSSVRMPNE